MKKILTLISILLIFSCTKNKLGGNSVIKGKVLHHEKPIPHTLIYIKFNSKDFPGLDTEQYNEVIQADAGGNYLIKCYKGDYFLFASGLDHSLPPPYTLKGGAPVHIRNNETLEINLAVTE